MTLFKNIDALLGLCENYQEKKNTGMIFVSYTIERISRK